MGEYFVSVHDTSLVRHRVYDEMYTGTRTVSKGAYENLYTRAPVKSPEKYRDSRTVNNDIS